MMLQPSLAATHARGVPPLPGLPDELPTCAPPNTRATKTRATRSLECCWRVPRIITRNSGSRYGLAILLAPGGASCDVDVAARHLIVGPGHLLHLSYTTMTEDD